MHRTRRWRQGVVACAAFALAACGGGAAEEEAMAAAAQTGPAPVVASDLIPGTPPGGLSEWISDIRTGIMDVPKLAAAAPAHARQRVLGLFQSRQEYIGLYYGKGGRLEGGAALAGSISLANARFHALVRLLGASPPASPEIAAAVAALDAQLAQVLAEAIAAGVPLVPATATPEAP